MCCLSPDVKKTDQKKEKKRTMAAVISRLAENY